MRPIRTEIQILSRVLATGSWGMTHVKNGYVEAPLVSCGCQQIQAAESLSYPDI